MTTFNFIITSIIGIWAIVSLIWGVKAAFTILVRKEDERTRMIVMKSMAQSFASLLVLHTVHAIIRLSLGAERHATWWSGLTGGIYINPAILCLLLLGTFMFINNRRFSAKGE